MTKKPKAKSRRQRKDLQDRAIGQFMLFVPDPAVEAEIFRLEELPLNRLRILWRERLGVVPNTRADLLRRRLANEL